ncbi:glycosyltransferase family 4 protein [Rahnella contaminans]|uniref:glycosyltransferase family 4 protein n=1 Tax=Rahnella contaminans TaxID=2703882 RepID=UPI001265F75B|nr:glycosyltransferase family 1 protein [Rouxiella chamberiensis]
MKNITYDKRWEGSHGIGRFSTEITKRLTFSHYLNSKIKPTSVLDIFVTAWTLLFSRDIFFTPGFNAPYIAASRSIITIHDLNHIDMPGNSSFLKRVYYDLILKRGCRKALVIFTVSEFSKKRIVDWSGVDTSKVIVVGNGVSNDFTPRVQPYRPGYPYLFCVSNRKAHKNEIRLIRAFAQAKTDNEVILLLSGNATPELTDLIGQLNLNERVKFTGFINDNDLPSYYRGATALIMPSLYEGFGLPVIEAMACGIPTIASRTTSLGEIAGDCALLVDPTNIEDIANSISQLFYDVELRQRLSEKGLEHVKLYTWDKTVKKIEDAISAI